MSVVIAPTVEQIRAAALQLLLPLGLRRLSLFGSFARGDNRPGSDIDLLVELDLSKAPGLDLIAWVGLELDLSAQLGCPVEMVRPEALNASLRPFIQEDLVLLYEAA